VVEVGKAQRIAKEEHRRVVADDVPVTRFGKNFSAKPRYRAPAVGGAALAGPVEKRANIGVCLPICEKIWPWCSA